MDCKEACRCMTSFLDGTYPVGRQAPLFMHYRHCENCKEELAVCLSLKHAMDALDNEDDSLDFINEDPMEAVDKLLDEMEARYHVEKQAYSDRFGLYVVAFWAVACTFLLQLIYWDITGFWFF